MIKVQIIRDSIAPSGVRLTTFLLVYPRFIHSELMTHRAFSRNASSSRAIPFAREAELIQDSPAQPISFKRNEPGMQGYEDVADQEGALKVWLEARDHALESARKLHALGVHKQYVNRLTECFAHITVVLTSTDFNNWFGLRYHPAAMPEICELAKLMWHEYGTGEPSMLSDGEWHLPFINEADVKEYMDTEGLPYDALLKRSVARCARVSYRKHDGTNATFAEDEELYNKLVGNSPMHASPAEHQAMAVGDPNVKSGNLTGWVQFRKTLKGENITSFEGPSSQPQKKST